MQKRRTPKKGLPHQTKPSVLACPNMLERKIELLKPTLEKLPGEQRELIEADLKLVLEKGKGQNPHELIAAQNKFLKDLLAVDRKIAAEILNGLIRKSKLG